MHDPDGERIDFSPLELRNGSARFEQMVQSIVSGVNSPPAPHLLYPLEHGLVSRGWVMGIVAAILAVSAWVPTLLQASSQSAGTSSEDPVELVSVWAHQGSVPSDVDVAHVLGAVDGR